MCIRARWYYADNTYAWDYKWRGELDLSLQRMKPVTMTEAGLSQALVSWGQQPSALTYQADASLTQQLGLPTYRATYFEGVGEAQRTNPVSYTHLDVYKRQSLMIIKTFPLQC